MTQLEAHIAGAGIATPYPVSNEQFLRMDEMMRRHHQQPQKTIDQLQSFTKGTGIHTRHYAHPHWLTGMAEKEAMMRDAERPPGALTTDIFSAHDYIPPYHERMKVFEATCVELAIAAARKALADWGGDPQDISHIYTTCTSGWSEPGVAVGVIEALGLSLDCAKAELNFNGCFCGATCLRIARDTVRAGDAKAVLVVAVEVASTHYDVNATDASSLVAHSLFADGAAAIVLAPQGKWRYEKTGMSLVPESKGLLGLDPPLAADHSSYRMYLDRHVGKKLGRYFAEGPGKDLLARLMDGENGRFPALGIHPGGPNILDNIKRVLLTNGWPEDAMDASYDVLQSYGNLGAAAMLFVLAATLNDIKESTLITMAFGPGVTVEWGKLVKVD
jgi:predicted naringenin-chalcone synthase